MKDKTFWFIQLPTTFFEDPRIDWLREQQNGDAYILIYLQMCLKTANNDGLLTRRIGEMELPYDFQKIAELCKQTIDTVAVAFDLFKKVGLVVEADGDGYPYPRIPAVCEMVKSVTQSAITKRRQRENLALVSGQNSGQTGGHCPDNTLDNAVDNTVDVVPQELRAKSLELKEKSIKTKEQKKTACELSAVYPPTFSAVLCDKCDEWFQYRKEIKKPFKAKSSLAQFVKKVGAVVDQHGERAVMASMDDSMANGWQGVQWDKIRGNGNGQSGAGAGHAWEQFNV